MNDEVEKSVLPRDFPIAIPQVPFSANCMGCNASWVHRDKDKDPICPKCGVLGFWEM